MSANPELPRPAPGEARAAASDREEQHLLDCLRAGDPAVVGRIVDDRLLLDLRTVLPGQSHVPTL